MAELSELTGLAEQQTQDDGATAVDHSGALVDVRDVELTYRTTGTANVAVGQATFQVRSGERLVLLGPSGCGKSTMLRAIAGFMKPSRGSISVAGKEVTGPGPDRAVVFQEFDQLFMWRKVQSNVSFPLRLNGHSQSAADEIAMRYLDMMGLAASADLYPHQLSGGMKQRVAIARAMSLSPTVLLMDEPFGALDAQTRSRLQVHLADVVRENHTTLVFVTHSIHEAIILGQRVIVLGHKPAEIVASISIPEGTAADTYATAKMQKDIGRALAAASGEETHHAFYE